MRHTVESSVQLRISYNVCDFAFCLPFSLFLSLLPSLKICEEKRERGAMVNKFFSFSLSLLRLLAFDTYSIDKAKAISHASTRGHFTERDTLQRKVEELG